MTRNLFKGKPNVSMNLATRIHFLSCADATSALAARQQPQKQRGKRLRTILTYILAFWLTLQWIDLSPAQSNQNVTEQSEETVDRDDINAEVKELKGDISATEAQPAARRADEEPFFALNYQHAHIIEVDGPIFGRFQWFLTHRLELARQMNADLVIVRLTSPGGDMESSLELARTLQAIQWAKVAIFIPKEAISGGAIVSLGADKIFMQSGAIIGDAGPIQLGMQGFEHAEEKVVSYLTGALGTIAEQAGRPSAIVQAMADRNLVVYQAIDRATGALTYLSEQDFASELIQAKYTKGEAVSETGNGRFLTVGAKRAKELLLCDEVFESENAFLDRLTIAKLTKTEMHWRDKLVYFLNNPWTVALLLAVGVLGLVLEFSAPGSSVFGLIAAFCFGIFFWSHFLGGTAGWLELILFLLGVGFLLAELFLLPGFGIFGIAGLALVAVSLIMASQDFLLPRNDLEWKTLQWNSLTVMGVIGGAILLLGAQIFVFDTIPLLEMFQLTPNTQTASSHNAELAADTSRTMAHFQAGDRGIADCDLRPAGRVRIGDSLVEAASEGDFINVGTPVEVIRRDGMRYIIRPLKPE